MRTWVLENLGLKLLSLFLAVFLWAVVLGEQKVEVTVNEPLDFDIPQNLFLANDPVDTVEVRLRGPKTLVTSLTAREVTMSQPPVALVEGENTIPIRDEMIRVPRGVQVVSVNPQRVRVVLEAATEREIEVSPRVEGSPPDGFVVRRVTSIPPRVRMVGPTSELRRITRVRTLPINLTGQTASFSARVLLEPVGRRVRVEDNASIVVEVEIGHKKS
jgi:YbbR domain-containing protein